MGFLGSFFGRRKQGQKTDISQRFSLEARLGTGSMSKVWRAVDRVSSRTVALKVLDREKTMRYEQRFLDRVKPTEGEVAVQLDHPHIVQTWEYGRTTHDEQFLVMELIEGVGLAYLVDVQNDAMRKHCLRVMIELGEAVAYLHENEWIHRDLCPRNVLLDKEYKTRLIDFGLVVPNTRAFQEPGNRTGTANYMAPELIKRQRTDQRIDIFSFSVTCYEMISRTLPWPSVTGATLEVVLKRINQPPRDLIELVPEVDEQLNQTIMRGLAPDPRDRWQTLNEMLVELRAVNERLAPLRKKAERKPKTKKKVRDPLDDGWQFKTK